MFKFITQILPTDSGTVDEVKSVVQGMTSPIFKNNSFDWISFAERWAESFLNFGIRVILALLLFSIGAWVIKHLKGSIMRILIKKEIEGVAISLINSIIIALLYIALGIAVASILGIQSVSFAAIIASMGLAIGMALSGQLQNLAGGVIIVLTKPFAIGNFIQSQGVEGTVKTVTLFHTIIVTPENRIIYIPNGALSNNVIVNFNSASTRRIEWIFGVDYASDINKALEILEKIVVSNELILQDPPHFIAVHELADSSVNLVVRAWVKSEDYLHVLFALNKVVFDEFNQAGISFPFPQVTISKRKD